MGGDNEDRAKSGSTAQGTSVNAPADAQGSGQKSNQTSNQASPLASFVCQGCGAPIAIHAAGRTVTAVCPSCGSTSENENGAFKLVKKFAGLMNTLPLIQLGTKGKLRGQTYQVIGFMRRHEKDAPDDPWDEYLLFNPFLGYAWLVESQGHWTLYKPTKSAPADPDHAGEYDRSISFLGHTFHVFHRGQAVVEFVLGEFYWRVRVGDSARTLEAVCPPQTLTRERDATETNWSVGEYVLPGEVTSAFNTGPLPKPVGVAPAQPGPDGDTTNIWLVWSVALLFLLAIQMFGKTFKPAHFVSSQELTVTPAGIADLEIAKLSNLSGSSHALIELLSNINQTWMTVNVRVVPDGSLAAPTHVFEKELSFYSGYDSDGENWSEGDQRAEFLLNGLPKGEYRVLLTASNEPGRTAYLTARVVLAPTIWSNFWLALFLLTLPPVWLTFRSRSSERNRWRESEYNPFDDSSEKS